jgi:MYXO-CTERM domain-containing protein
MNRPRLFILVSASLLLASGLALAQATPPDAGAAAAADEAFAPGPGGGERDAGDGRPPLESTGLEDSVGGSCGCRVVGAPAPAGLGLLALALVAGAVARRRQPRQYR